MNSDTTIPSLDLAMLSAELAVVHMTKDYRYIRVNDVYAKFIGKTRAEIEGFTCFEVLPGFEKSTVYEPLRMILEDGHESYTGVCYSSFFDRYLFAVGYRTPSGGVTAFFRRATDEQLQMFKDQRNHEEDALTLLPNRLAMEKHMDSLRRADKKYGVVFFDLDRFKAVNDSYGHAIGDRVLMWVGQTWGMFLQDKQRIFRLSGDEFVLIVEDQDDETAMNQLAEKFIDVIQQPIKVENHTCFIGASAGIALCPRDGDEPMKLLQRADMAMYRAKKDASRVQPFIKRLEEEALFKALLEVDVQKAIDQNELQLYYQPKADLSGMVVCGSEALLRWNHPVRGMVPPNVFLPAMDTLGMMPKVDMWVLESAIKDIQRSMQKNIMVPVAVNISSYTLQKESFVDQVWAMLSRYGVPAHLLEIEITENGLMKDIDTSKNVLRVLNDIGVNAAIDDFGTGYSSLAYLLNFQVKTLKIDRSFVMAMDQNHIGVRVVQGLIRMAHSMRMDVVAEGVETSEQLETLQSSGCQTCQGYYYSRPLPYDKFVEFCKDKGVRNLRISL